MVKKVKTDSLKFFGNILGGKLDDNSSQNKPSFSMHLVLAPALIVLALYKIFFSPVLYALGVRCRHSPSCSLYSGQAFVRHGPWRGGWLTLSRVSRCHPFGSHGIDPVPDELEKAGWKFWRYGDWAWNERNGEQEKKA